MDANSIKEERGCLFCCCGTFSKYFAVVPGSRPPKKLLYDLVYYHYAVYQCIMQYKPCGCKIPCYVWKDWSFHILDIGFDV